MSIENNRESSEDAMAGLRTQPRTMHEHAEHGRVSIRIATPTRYTDAVSVGIVLGTVRVRGCDRSEDTTGKCWCRRSRCWSEKGHHLRARYASRQPHSNMQPPMPDLSVLCVDLLCLTVYMYMFYRVLETKQSCFFL